MATTYTTNYNLGKQENHADKFDMDVITDNADKIDAALTELQSGIDGKQATLTTEQLTAVNSGIDSDDVAQITTNKNNILLTADQTTQYNVFDFANSPVENSTTTYTKTDSSIAVSSSNATWKYVTLSAPLKAGTYIYKFKVSDYVGTESRIVITTDVAVQQQLGAKAINTNGTFTIQFTVASDMTIYFTYFATQGTAGTNSFTTSDNIIIPKSLYDAGFTNYQPYALSNAELTEITNNFNNVKSVITNTNTTFTPDTNCHYLVLMQSSTSSALYAVYKTSAINIAKITGTMTSDSVTESGGIVTIATTAWSMISIIKIGKSSN